jgi:hypothetical protein
MKHPFTALALAVALQLALPAYAAGTPPEDRTIVFVCLHGSVKSQMAAAEAGNATRVIAFDSVPDENRGLAEVSYWSDVPPATKNYVAARDMIARHIDDLVPALAADAAPSKEAVRGVVTTVDERNDQIALRLSNGSIEALKVQDGLVFNAVRFGDQVEITVESIDGARTIVALKKE